MNITKRDGSHQSFKPNKIVARIAAQAKGLKVDADGLSIKVIQGFADGITTSQLDTFTAETAATMMTNHPDYGTLAARIAITALHKETQPSFSMAVAQLAKDTTLLQEEDFVWKVMDRSHELDEMIVHERDFNFDYFGYRTLAQSYLLKINGKIVERPQYLWMRVAVALWKDNLPMIKQTYDDLSQGLYTHATPTLFNAGTRMQQLSSCFLLANGGDSIEGITQTFTDIAKISSLAGGIGLHIHDLRAEGTHIAGSGGTSNGVKPYLKSLNEWSKYWDQGGGKRKGSFAVYAEPWHKDIHWLLSMRKNHGKEEDRARELFPALWVPDLFMERVEAFGKWTLFCPHEVLMATGKKLQDVTGEEFRTLYEHCESLGIGKTIEAQDLWMEILTSQRETGTPYMVYKDASNLKSNQKNLGTIKSSNLCTEILEYSDAEAGEQAVCNLASLALPKFLKEFTTHYDTASGEAGRKTKLGFDHEALYHAAYQVTLNLNRVIDINYYPTPETKKSNMLHRPIGIGVQGLADVFALLKLPFDSLPAKELNRDIFETIYYGFLRASNHLAKKEGYYSSFPGSPSSEGQLQFSMWGVTPTFRWDWVGLKHDIIVFGLRNSLGLAPMPTASTSQILGNNECFEPFNSNMSLRRTLAGEFILVNKHLIRDLEELGLWSAKMKNEIIVANGSVQGIAFIPGPIRERYKTAFEISQKVILDMAADRGAYICQSQSMNLFVENPTVGKLSSMHFYGWKKGLKTGMYYLRTKAAVGAIKFTAEKVEAAPLACSIDNPDCEACGA